MIIEQLLDELNGSDDTAVQELLSTISTRLNRNIAVQDSLHRVQQTWLNDEVPVTADGNGDGRDPIGDAYFDRINLVGGTATVNADEPRQIDISLGGTAGSGADCMFDYLVSSCFATLSGFTEGEVFSSVSGCTFQGYSTIQGAATAISALSAPNLDPVLYICPGVYVENVVFSGPTANTVTIIGAGRLATQITGPAAFGTTLAHTVTSSTLFILENLRVNASNTVGAICIGDVGGSSNWLVRNCQINTSATASSIGIYTGPSTASTPWRFEQCLFSGSGTGFADSGPGDTGVVWGNVMVQNSSFTVATGVWFSNDNNFTAENCMFTGLIGIKNDASQTVDGLKLNTCFFRGCTSGVISTGGGGFRRGQIESCRFESCVTAIDFGTVANASTAFEIEGNTFIAFTGSNKAIDDTSGQLSQSIILGNSFTGYTAGNEIIGVDTSDNQIAHNTTDSGFTLPDTHIGGAGGAGANEPYVVYAPPTALPNAKQYINVSGAVPTPATTPEGAFFYNTTTDALYVNDTTAWRMPFAFKVYLSLGEVPVSGHSFS